MKPSFKSMAKPARKDEGKEVPKDAKKLALNEGQSRGASAEGYAEKCSKEARAKAKGRGEARQTLPLSISTEKGRAQAQARADAA
jgi:hypothetical protein